MSRTDKALATLVKLIEAGWEFPDAVCKAAREHKVSVNKLTIAYDVHCAT